tara:strand:+ start:142 stop:879 length:738 start_codon:yes stop_codon:yes gene_type:complete
MISIDTVYQKVLNLANKEQRGYITPQEFNLFANQAQLEIFEQYFYDLNQQTRIPGNEYVYADVDDMLEEKLQIFEKTDFAGEISFYAPVAGGYYLLPDYIYRVSRIEYNNADCELLKTKDFNNCVNGGPLTKPSDKRPIANIRNNILRIIGTNNTGLTPTVLIYLRKPAKPMWGYTVIGGKALHDTSMYDPTTGLGKTYNFELHQSEESELVYKILKYAGVSMKRDDIMRAGQGMETSQVQQEKI